MIRAFVQNANMLALGPELFMDDDALSPWTFSNPYPTLAPHTLSPTILQLSTPHHPYLDVIASPSFRDNVLLTLLTEEQEEQLCFEMHRTGFTVWGSQPWNSICICSLSPNCLVLTSLKLMIDSLGGISGVRNGLGMAAR